MRRITCTKLGEVKALTVGTSYAIIEETENRFIILNDKGVQSRYGKNLFTDPIEIADAPVMAGAIEGVAVPARRRGRPSNAEIAARVAQVAPVAAAPAPARVVEQIEVNTNAENEDGSVDFSVSFDFGNRQTFTRNERGVFETSGISASCGILSLNGLDSLAGFIHNLRSGFDNFVAQNRASFVLAADLNIDELFSQVSEALLQDLVATYQGEDADMQAGALILSTTSASINRTPMLREALDTIAASTVTVNNPNSGNEIVMWNVAVVEAD